MAEHLLNALEGRNSAKRPYEFTFQHKPCHDFESLIWVIVYAMMIRRKNILRVTDPVACKEYIDNLDRFWGVHSYAKISDSHENMIGSGSNLLRVVVEEKWFPEPLEAEFFRAAMRLVRPQVQEGEPITYEKMQDLFQTYVQKAKQADIPTLAPA